MENLKAIIKEIKDICFEFNMRTSDDMILDCSTRIFNSQNIQEDKLNKPKSDYKSDPFELATERQKDLMRKLKIMYDSNITKLEAKQIINTKLEKKYE